MRNRELKPIENLDQRMVDQNANRSGNETVIQLNQGWNQILLENESVTTGKGANDNTWQFRMNLMHPLGMGQVPGLSNFTNNAKPNAQ